MKGVKTWMTTQWNKDDLFYVCSMIEFVARETHNKVKDVVGKMTDEDLLHQLKAASENHCLFYERVSGEWIDGAERKKNEKSDCIHICASWKYGKISKKDSRGMSGRFDRCYKTNERRFK